MTDLLRFTTAGSVDDGKSTLIGRLLYDTKSIFEDQLEAIRGASRRRGDDRVNLALLTDGLRAEREQKITIDVAYRYFATPRRKFIIADTPGHEQYTRNMVTGASTAHLAVVLVDARKGVLTQSRRHAFISSLLGIPHMVVAVNKMDLVDWSEDAFDAIADDFRAFAAKLAVRDIVFVPLSALEGDNVARRSERMPWYQGPSLLHHLETVNIFADRNLVDFRLPVQYVVRPGQHFRGFAGEVASGTISVGEEVVALPSGRTSRVRDLRGPDGDVERAAAGDPVVLRLEDEIDVARGDMIVRRHNLPQVGRRVEAMLCWMSERPLEVGRPLVLRHTTRAVQAYVTNVLYRIDVDSLHREPAETLGLNEIGRVEVETADPLFFDPYRVNRATGAFVLIDGFGNGTVAAGMVRGGVRTPDDLARESGRARQRETSPDVTWEPEAMSLSAREERNGHLAAVVWFTGLSGSGKSTLARAVEQRLFEAHCQTVLLDGDRVRHGLSGDLGFSPEDRAENIRRVAEVARLFFEQGSIALCTFVSPYARDRARARALVPEGRFFEVFVRCDIDECRRRDPKGLYARADRGEIDGLTGVSAPYEAPDAPELVADTQDAPVEDLADRVLAMLRDAGVVPPARA
ncbi:MAG TPA: sulfate adenylyltransferase subunit CysN [Longimicrobiales bacterium]|nr:sulfate adenylyltransferase subunit CysN [Longimicrobiales bacterium]